MRTGTTLNTAAGHPSLDGNVSSSGGAGVKLPPKMFV